MKFTLIGLVIILCLICGTVSAENSYVPVEQPTISPYGHLYVHVLCMNNLISKDMVLTNNAGDNTIISLQPDGTLDTPLIADDYILVLIDGNSGHSETRHFTITGGETTYVWFIGHARSMDEIKAIITSTPTPTIEPTETVSPEPSPTITPEVTSTPIPTESSTPEPTPYCHWANITSEIYHPEENHTIQIPEANHTSHHPATTKTIRHPAIIHTEYRYWIDEYQICERYNREGFCIDLDTIPGHWSEWSKAKPNDPYYQSRTVIDKPARNETVIVKPAWDEIVVDIPAHSQIIIDSPAWTETMEIPNWVCDSVG